MLRTEVRSQAVQHTLRGRVDVAVHVHERDPQLGPRPPPLPLQERRQRLLEPSFVQPHALRDLPVDPWLAPLVHTS